MAGEEKTEKATPKKRRDVREKEGSVLQSHEVVTAVSVLGIFLALALLAQYMYRMMLDLMETLVSQVGNDITFNSEYLTEISITIIRYCVLIIGPIMLIAMVLGVLPDIIQTKGLFSMKPLRFKFSRLNPLTGIKRLFSAQSVVGIVKGLLEMTIIAAVVYSQIIEKVPEIKKLSDMEVQQGVVYTANTIFTIIMIISVFLLFVAAGDFVFQWWQFEKNLKMSKQEIKDEYKQMEGDPQIKGKIKQKQREIANQRMMDQVPEADVVVRNPTHYAVALKYDASKPLSAPIVVAKGADSLAMKIVGIAEENEVYITENRPLARSLYDSVEIGKEIPPSLFVAVATVISEMYTAKGIKPNLSSEK